MPGTQAIDGGPIRVTRYAQLDEVFYLEIERPAELPLMVAVESTLLQRGAPPGRLIATLGRLGVELDPVTIPRLVAQAERCRRSTSGVFEAPY